MIVNDLSAKFPVKEVRDGRKIMEEFLKTCFAVKKIIQNDSILLDQDYQSFELAQGYRIEKWRNDPEVDREIKRRFYSILNKSQAYPTDDSEWESEFRTKVQGDEHCSRGCLLACETDGVMTSFLSDEEWKKAEISGSYVCMHEDGALEERKEKVPNVSCAENIELFRKCYEQKKEDKRYTEVKSAKDILNLAEEVFPNLVFCDHAIAGCKKDVGVSEAGQVYKRLLELQRVAESMTKQFKKDSLTKATTETGITLQQYGEEHTFLLPDGNLQLFSWHVRYTGSYAGRIFFHPVCEENKIYIGHVGHKLPTVKYPH